MKCKHAIGIFVLLSLAAFASRAAAQEWIQLSPTGGPPQASGCCGGRVYDPDSNRAMLYGPYPFHTTEVWALANADGLGGTPEWVNIVPAGAFGPLGRHWHATAYDSINNRMIIFSGCSGGCLPLLTDVWVLANADGFDPSGNPAAASWSQLSPTSDPAFGAPVGRAGAVAVYDPLSNQMILFGGQNGGGSWGYTYPEVWRLSHANGLGGTPAWSRVATAGTFPPGQALPAAAYDAANNRMTVFGGMAYGTGAGTNAVWALSNANGTELNPPTWTNVVAEGALGSPPAAGWREATYDAANSRLILLDPVSGLNTTWVLQHANGLGGPAAWQRLVTTGQPTSDRPVVNPVYNPGSNRLNALRATPSGVGAEAWVLTNANGVTNQLPVASAGADQTVECAGPTSTPGTLNGSGSSDPDNDPLTYTWTGPFGTATGVSPAVNLPYGTSTITLVVNDGKGDSDPDTVAISVQDTTPPTLTLAHNSTTVVLPTAGAPGAPVNVLTASGASATDVCCEPNPTLLPAGVSDYTVGTTTVMVTASDCHSNTSEGKPFVVNVVYNFSGFLPPIRVDGSGIFRSGRTIPVKFQLTAADGSIVSNATATLLLAKVSGNVIGSFEEITPEAAGNSNLDNLFRFDPASGQYIYNLQATGFSAGTYVLRAHLNDGTDHDVYVSVR